MSAISLSSIILTLEPRRVENLRETEVSGIACHPEQVKGPGFLFVCMNEYLEYNVWQTWRTHLQALPGLKLAAVVVPEFVEGLSLPQLIVNDPRQSLGHASAFLHGNPDQRLQFFGVTGTNGKTTTTRLLSHLFTQLGHPCGSIGTLGISLPGKLELPGTYTTPLSPELHEHIATLESSGARGVSMEVSSHALALDRVAGLSFTGAILTNIERDHLDFHGTQEAYAEAKRRLFTMVKPEGCCLLNMASPHCRSIAEASSARTLTYGMESFGADYEASEIELHPEGSRFVVCSRSEHTAFETRLAGSFQVENALAAIGMVHQQGHSLQSISEALEGFAPVCGRMEQIPMPNGSTAIVDYAHNPDGLEHLLVTCRSFCPGRLHVVFGCGGDRDKGKRPIMGSIADRLADVCWVTSDNPRTEDPEQILDDIITGMRERSSRHRIADRAIAIREAYAATVSGDLLVVAGKGHEDYQIIGHTKHHFSDQEILRKFGL